MTTSGTTTSTADAPRTRRIGAGVLAPVLLLPVLLLVMAWVATRSWFICLVAVPALESGLGGDVEIGSASYRGSGTIVLEDVTLRNREFEGPSAQALRVGRAVVRFELGHSLRGGMQLKRIRLDDVLVRMSEDQHDPGLFNFHGLGPEWSSDAPGDALLPPSVQITSATIEMGTHDQGRYWKHGDCRVTGHLQPAADGGGWYQFELRELDDDDTRPKAGGLRVEGEWNVETLEHWASLEGLVLDERTKAMCPQRARRMWDLMQPEGPVGTARIEWRKDHDYKAELDVDQVAMTLPIAVNDFFPGFEAAATLPRMHVRSGTLTLDGNRLTLEDLIGEFRSGENAIGMPYAVTFAIEDIPSIDWENQQAWMETILKTAPFEMSLRMDEFSLGQATGTPAEAMELPRQVVDTMSKFNLTDWTLTTKVTVSRGAPAVNEDGTFEAAPVLSTGQAYIRDASGAFIGFPYPLDHVNAYVEFDNEQITIHYLNARGSDNATVRMSGTITPPGRSAEVALRLIARDVPLDDRFRQALKGGQLATYDRMLHKASYQKIIESGTLPDGDGIARVELERQALLAELNKLHGAVDEASDKERRRLQREIRRLSSIVDAGPFELGGTIDLDLDILRAFGEDQSTRITGGVDIHRAGVVYERFPYPIYLLGGRLDVQADRIAITPDDGQPGLPISTPGGGRGRIVGEVRLVRDGAGGHVEPDLAFELRNDALSDLLYAALPMGEGEKPHDDGDGDEPPDPDAPRHDRSLIARVLSGAGLTGWLDHHGTITADAEGNPTFDIAVELSGGAARPNEELFETMREFNLPSPKGLTLDGVEALLRMTPRSLELVDFAGHHKGATITATGAVDLRSDPLEAELLVNFNNLELDRYMIELTPGAAERTAELWERYRPEGTYSARLEYRTGADHDGKPELVLWPKTLRVAMGGRDVWIECERGELTLNAGSVNFDDFRMRIRSDQRPEGLVVLDGSYGLGTAQTMRLEGSWTEGELASPIIGEALRLIGAQEQHDQYVKYSPTGIFDADFYVNSRGAGKAEYEFRVHPASLGMRINDVPVWASLDPTAEIGFTPGRIVLRNVGGEHAGGRFHVDGRLDVGDAMDIDMDMTYQGRIDSPQVTALLPAPVRKTFERLDVSATDKVDLQDAWLRATELPPAEPGGPSRWSTAFGGRLATEGASMRAGVFDLREVDGLFEVLVEHDPESGTTMDVKARASHATMMGRDLSAVETRVYMDKNRMITVPALRAEAYGGVVSGRARIGLDPGSPYELRLELAGVSLEGFAERNPADEQETDEPPEPPGNPPRGETYGAVALMGTRGEPETRRGRGALRVAWGKMASMPLALRFLQVFELMPPLAGQLDFADVEMFVSGDRIVFERLVLECPTLRMLGEGEMSYPDLELDVRFRTKGTLPLFGDLVAGISNQIFIVQITGPLADPKARLVPLPAVQGGKPPAISSAGTVTEGG